MQLRGSLRWQRVVLCSMPGSFPVSILVASSSALLPACTPRTDSPNPQPFVFLGAISVTDPAERGDGNLRVEVGGRDGWQLARERTGSCSSRPGQSD